VNWRIGSYGCAVKKKSCDVPWVLFVRSDVFSCAGMSVARDALSSKNPARAFCAMISLRLRLFLLLFLRGLARGLELDEWHAAAVIGNIGVRTPLEPLTSSV
jgi:hypothetical protein